WSPPTSPPAASSPRWASAAPRAPSPCWPRRAPRAAPSPPSAAGSSTRASRRRPPLRPRLESQRHQVELGAVRAAGLRLHRLHLGEMLLQPPDHLGGLAALERL